MNEDFETIINRAFSRKTDGTALIGIDLTSQFNPDSSDASEIQASLNAAFLIALCGEKHHLYSAAKDYLRDMTSRGQWSRAAIFFTDAIKNIETEIATVSETDDTWSQLLERAARELPPENEDQARRQLWPVFFPEGAVCLEDKDEGVRELRNRRKVTISRLAEDPVRNPSNEILFTSNVLLGMPLEPDGADELDVSDHVREVIREIREDPQDFWYDHPIHIGTPPANNEALYGVKGLEAALSFETSRGNIEDGEKTDCVLSVSVTHKGLHAIAKEYVMSEFRKAGKIDHLNVYVMTEVETRQLIKEVFLPAMEAFLGTSDVTSLERVFGVDGEYGRHYSFLKAVSALWQVFRNPKLKGTFKIDLDQVFPQNELVAQTGSSAFEHFMSPLWGSRGTDSAGRQVELGMIAGALVNEKDIDRSLFTPDVTFPDEINGPESLFFFKGLPMAFSTEAEMMTRYSAGTGIDGRKSCIQRVHVTGGTNGILVRCLRKHRPFTPTFIGRAEDQAYLMSVMHKPNSIGLRYYHEDGLVMRHDKEAFAGESIKAAHLGRQIGDLVRIVYFSNYARTRPWSWRETKDSFDPFTGAYISRIPLSLVYLNFASSLLSLFEADGNKASQLFDMGTERLGNIINYVNQDPCPLKEEFSQESEGWDTFYDLLDLIEQKKSAGDSLAEELVRRGRSILQNSQVVFQ